MRRKTLAGLAGLTLAIALLALALLVGVAAGGHGPGKGHGKGPGAHGRIGFHFLVLDQIAGTSDRLILQVYRCVFNRHGHPEPAVTGC